MLNLPSPQAVLPLDLAVPAEPPELLPAAGPALPAFAGMLAASGALLPAAGGTLEPVSGEIQTAESPAIEQAWASVLVPELANLPAEFIPPAALPEPAPEPAPGSGAAAGDMLGRGVAALNFGLAGPWPLRAVSSPRLAGLAPAADPGRVRGWQNGLPSPPALPSPPITATAPPPVDPPPADFILRNVTGQPIPFPTDDQPPWYDPHVAPPWFDPTNPPPPWSDPTRPPPAWYDPTKVPPAWLDPARIPASWFDTPRPPAMTISALTEARPEPAPTLAVSPPTSTPLPPAAGPAPAPAVPVNAPTTDKATAPAPDPVTPPVSAPVSTPFVATAQADVSPPAARRGPVAQPPIRAERPRRAGFDEQPVLAERAQPAFPMPTFTLAALPPSLATPATAHASAAARPNPSPAPPLAAAETNPALTVSSDRLGDVAVRLSGGPDQLQVVMQAQPAAAALIGADAPRLSQDLAAAGVALAGLSVNGQRAELGGGGRDRQRQSSRRDDGVPIAASRRLAARPAQNPLGLNRPATIDRFA
jgi:hypothetical protein